ncbi:hypothetical protein [Morganella morganii]|uniref:hypothetical protein n=1 Tax=Morganella morganii TaxID=582 RepID=UPI001BDB8847|nr:hypothetical protein [Morganella morganii]MBT0460411.1 hypothetical protein [Morganella morganii subsp. morganii]MDR5686753.1 hypothetical protein [Morganella morganii]
MPDKTQANDVGIGMIAGTLGGLALGGEPVGVAVGVIGGGLAYAMSSESNSPYRPEPQMPEYIDFNDMYCPNPNYNYY